MSRIEEIQVQIRQAQSLLRDSKISEAFHAQSARNARTEIQRIDHQITKLTNELLVEIAKTPATPNLKERITSA